VAYDDEAALRGNASEGVGLMRLFDVDGAVAVVGPDDSARAGIEGVEEDAHERPDASGEVDGIVGDHRGTAGRPGGNQAFVTKDLAVRGAAAKLPKQRALVGIDTIKVAIVRDDEEAVLPDSGGEAHRASSAEAPFLDPGFSIIGRHIVSE